MCLYPCTIFIRNRPWDKKMLLKLCDLHQNRNGSLDLVKLPSIHISLKRGCLFRGTGGVTELHSSLHSNSNALVQEDERYRGREVRSGIEPWTSQLPLGRGVCCVVSWCSACTVHTVGSSVTLIALTLNIPRGGPLRTPEGDFLWFCRNYIN